MCLAPGKLVVSKSDKALVLISKLYAGNMPFLFYFLFEIPF